MNINTNLPRESRWITDKISWLYISREMPRQAHAALSPVLSRSKGPKNSEWNDWVHANQGQPTTAHACETHTHTQARGVRSSGGSVRACTVGADAASTHV
eukprot:5362705-Pleurochrysis_carterae.AAC.1